MNAMNGMNGIDGVAAKIRVVVVEDSVTVRKRLVEVLNADPAIEVVGEAGDGKEAIERCLALRPDVVTMDMMLPVMSGLAATEYIMAHCPTPILVVSSSTNRGELFRTYETLAAGAVEVLEKPREAESDADWEVRFLSTLKLVARIRVITHLRARLRARDEFSPIVVPPPTASWLPDPAVRCALVAIGASTGGPGAIVDLLRSLPASFSLPILLVLHIGDPFGVAFADWLDGRVERHVAFARHGEPLSSLAGQVRMAPPGRHLVVSDGGLRLSSEAERHFCRPSVDVLFESVARALGPTGAGCLLTGMGRDGAAGLLEIRRAGGMTIAQDEPSSVVYGMPREAALLGAAVRILPLDHIGPALAALGDEAPWVVRP
jgi:two-component system chemotaxis response regulator CheB